MGLIKSIKKRIKRYKERRADCKFKRDLENDIETFLNSSESGITEVKRERELIVSLTSFPPRIATLHYTLFSLFNQNIKPNKILLILSKLEFPNLESDLPTHILKFKEHGLEIIWEEANIKSYKKLIPVLKIYPDSIIVTADDDAIYPKDWLIRLVNAYEKNPQFIHCHRAHKIDFDKNGKILPYNDWASCVSYNEVAPSFLNFFTGLGGVLYPPHCFHQDILKPLFLEIAPHQDDIWFWAMGILNGYKINVVENNYQEFKSFCNPYKDSLWEINETENDIVLQKIFSMYPALQEKIAFKSGEYWNERYKGYVAGGGLI